MLLKKQLGQKIQYYRKKRKYTQEQLAEKIGIDPKSISKIENGNNYPSADNLSLIAKVLDVEVFELFLFKNSVSIEDMRREVISAIKNEKTLKYIYQILKGID